MCRTLMFLFSLVIITHTNIFGITPVELNGQLRVDSNKIVNKDGNPVQLHGMSMYWSQWGAQYYKKATVDWLVKDWNISVIRAAMAVEESVGGYLSDPEGQMKLVDTIVQAAIANGIYVIIDWHEENAYKHTDSSKHFFETMATKYASYPNVIYEIYNEPARVTWDTVKKYADTLVKAIRAIDDSNLIVVGTPNWCQSVDEPALKPVTGFPNIAYSLHFYAATHKSLLRNVAKESLDKKIALFVTEWGTCTANGNGMIDLVEVRKWMQFMEDNKLSWCNWSIYNKPESASALRTAFTVNWKTDDLRQSGLIVRSLLRNYAGVDSLDTVAFKQKFDTLSPPARIEAEKFAIGKTVTVEKTDDTSGVNHIAGIQKGDWVTYTMQNKTKNKFVIQTRVASNTTGGAINLYIGDVLSATLKVPSDTISKDWTTISTSGMTIDTGRVLIRLTFDGDSTDTNLFKINWLELVPDNAVIRPLTQHNQPIQPVISSNGLTIELPEHHSLTSMKIISINGMTIRESLITPAAQKLTMQGLPKGYYIVRLTGKETVSVPLFIYR